MEERQHQSLPPAQEMVIVSTYTRLWDSSRLRVPATTEQDSEEFTAFEKYKQKKFLPILEKTNHGVLSSNKWKEEEDSEALRCWNLERVIDTETCRKLISDEFTLLSIGEKEG
jgi:hypothetical protein